MKTKRSQQTLSRGRQRRRKVSPENGDVKVESELEREWRLHAELLGRELRQVLDLQSSGSETVSDEESQPGSNKVPVLTRSENGEKVA